MLATARPFRQSGTVILYFLFYGFVLMFSFVSCASVHLFGFTISLVLGFDHLDLIYWPQILHLHYTGARLLTVITNWASETKKSRTVCSQRLRTRIERPFETSLKRWKQVTLARHAKVESFSVFSLDDHDSWHQAVIEETSRKIIVTTVRLEFRVNFCTNRIWIRFNIWRHYKWRHRNTLNRYSVFCFFFSKVLIPNTDLNRTTA